MKNTDKTNPLSARINSIWNAAGSFFYLGCQWLVTVMVVLLSDNYQNSGELAYAMSVGNMFATIGLYKIRTYQVSDVNSLFDSNTYVAFRFITIGVSALGTIAIQIGIMGITPLTITSLAYLLFKADETFNDVFFGIEQKHERMDYIGKSQFIRGVVSLGSFCLALLLFDNLILAIICMAASCMCITNLYDKKNAKLFGYTRASISIVDARLLSKVCLIPTVSNLLATSIVSVARQYYGITCGEELLGIYASIATPAVLVQAAASYIYIPYIGELAKTLTRVGRKQFKRQFLQLLITMSLIVILGSIPLTLIGDQYLPVIFEGTSDYAWIFRYVLLSTGAVALLYLINDVLIVLRKNAIQIVVNLLAFTTLILLLNPLISSAGMNGVNLSIIYSCLAASCVGSIYILTCK